MHYNVHPSHQQFNKEISICPASRDTLYVHPGWVRDTFFVFTLHVLFLLARMHPENVLRYNFVCSVREIHVKSELEARLGSHSATDNDVLRLKLPSVLRLQPPCYVCNVRVTFAKSESVRQRT